MVNIIILGTILMKNNTLIYSDYKNFIAKKKELKNTLRPFKEKTKRHAVEFVEDVIDSNDPGFVMGRLEKRPVNFFNKLYYITYKGIRILPHDTK